MMVQYSSNELVSVTQILKSFSSYMDKIKSNSLEKIGVLKNNQLEAVVISTKEYERLKEIDELLKQSQGLRDVGFVDEAEQKEIEEALKNPECYEMGERRTLSFDV
jgi:PHD/YefM family antitoxin component YafN of YafNO toxin-antitoxin module